MTTINRKWNISWKSSPEKLLIRNGSSSSSSSSGGSSSSSSSRNIAVDKISKEIILPSPPGFLSLTDPNNSIEGTMMTAEAAIQAKQRQVMAIAYGPGKNLLSTAFMLWMSGSSIQIFSIMATGMALINPIKSIASINQVFEKFEKEEGVDLRFPKLIFVALQILSIAIALYKCSTMGLLPVTSADWTSLLPEKVYLESAALPVKF